MVSVSNKQQKKDKVMSNKRQVHLLTIDPQNDFCIANGPGGEKGALVVGGADADMNRLAAFINRNQRRIDEIHCTLDSHQTVHIAHPIFWVNSKGEHPNPFTLITADDVRNGTWRANHPALQARAQGYVDTLAKNGRYVLCIWPAHCIIGSWGASIVPVVSDALIAWEKAKFERVNYVPKGSNFLTEHYSGVQADVVDDSDASTKLNVALIDALTIADEILITGEALSHCVANTVQDVATQFGEDNIKKFTLLVDTSSSVTHFEKLGQDFIANMTKRGMKIAKSTDW
jgi:nicotinamidase/pyrazinamidase